MIWLVPLLTSSIASVFAIRAAAMGPSMVADAITSSDQETSMVALNKYVRETPRNTTKAVELRDDWLRWYDGLDWWDVSFDEPTYAEARNRKSAFDLANATSAEERSRILDMLRLDPSRLSTGFLPGGSGIMPSWVRPAAYGVGAGALGLLAISFLRKAH